MDAILFDGGEAGEMADARFDELNEDEQTEDKWRQLWKEAREDLHFQFEELKETLVEGISEGDRILLVRRDQSESELHRPSEVFDKWDHLIVYYEDGDIWIKYLDKYDAEYKALWVPAQKEDTNFPEDMKEDCWNLRSMASMGLDASDTAYMLDLCEAKSIATVFREELKWNGVNIFKEAKSEATAVQRDSRARRR